MAQSDLSTRYMPASLLRIKAHSNLLFFPENKDFIKLEHLFGQAN